MKIEAENCGCSEGEFKAQLEEESRKIGENQLLSEIEKEAREALGSLPRESELRNISKVGRQLIARLSELYIFASSASKWSTKELELFTHEMAWVTHVCDIQVSYMINTGGHGVSGSRNCREVYDECLNNHNCSDGWVCLCCVPCSIKYSKCIITGGAFERTTYFM